MKKRQRAARGGELVQKQDRGSGGSYSGSLHSAPRRSGQQRSRFVVQGLRGHRVRGLVRVAPQERGRGTGISYKEAEESHEGFERERRGRVMDAYRLVMGVRPTRFQTRRLSRRCSRGSSRCAPLWTRPRRRRTTTTSSWTSLAGGARIAVGPRDFSFAHRHHRKAPKGEGHGKQQK